MDNIQLLFNKLNVKWTNPYKKGFIKLDNGNRVEIMIANKIDSAEFFEFRIWFPTGNACSESFSVRKDKVAIPAAYNFEKMEFCPLNSIDGNPQTLPFVKAITNYLDTWNDEDKYFRWMEDFEKNEKMARYGVQ